MARLGWKEFWTFPTAELVREVEISEALVMPWFLCRFDRVVLLAEEALCSSFLPARWQSAFSGPPRWRGGGGFLNL